MESLLDTSVREIFTADVESALAEGEAMIGVGCEFSDGAGKVGFGFDDFGDARIFAHPRNG